jgi:pyruvyltransferase
MRLAELCNPGGLRTFWCIDRVNFGDLLTPALLRHYGFNPVWATAHRAKVIAVGSLLQAVPETYDGYILGTGLIYSSCAPRFDRATVLGIRGKLTHQRIGSPRGVVLGDPGLLAARLLSRRHESEWTLGIVPHYIEKADRRVQQIKRRFPDHVRVIDVQRPSFAVLEDIDKCEFILSSSLHGLVVADALGKRNGWMYLTDKVAGGGFKFHDYYSALETTRQPFLISGSESLSELLAQTYTPPSTIPEVQEQLHSAFQTLHAQMAAQTQSAVS